MVIVVVVNGFLWHKLLGWIERVVTGIKLGALPRSLELIVNFSEFGIKNSGLVHLAVSDLFRYYFVYLFENTLAGLLVEALEPLLVRKGSLHTAESVLFVLLTDLDLASLLRQVRIGSYVAFDVPCNLLGL